MLQRSIFVIFFIFHFSPHVTFFILTSSAPQVTSFSLCHRDCGSASHRLTAGFLWANDCRSFPPFFISPCLHHCVLVVLFVSSADLHSRCALWGLVSVMCRLFFAIKEMDDLLLLFWRAQQGLVYFSVQLCGCTCAVIQVDKKTSTKKHDLIIGLEVVSFTVLGKNLGPPLTSWYCSKK